MIFLPIENVGRKITMSLLLAVKQSSDILNSGVIYRTLQEGVIRFTAEMIRANTISHEKQLPTNLDELEG